MSKHLDIERLNRAVKIWHAHGLDRRYDDILDQGNADGLDVIEMMVGTHYDYRTQAWVDGHDHGHTDANGRLPLIFCGSDKETCLGERMSI